MSSSNMNCEEFDALLPDYLEGTLDAELSAKVERHLRGCVRCAGLVKDINEIRKDAAALPELAPTRDLWAGIESRIAAPVVPLMARPAAQKRLKPAWLSIAAAALVVSTAGITYMLTARSIGKAPADTVATATPATGAETSDETAATGGESQNVPIVVYGVPERRAVRNNASPTAPAPAGSNRGAEATVASRDKYAPLRSDIVYSKEIAMLQKIVGNRRSQLDSATIAVIERNLMIIDAAIAQSKAALAGDPASRLLGDQLTHALDKKVELLRTAAMLPSST